MFLRRGWEVDLARVDLAHVARWNGDGLVCGGEELLEGCLVRKRGFPGGVC